jgi:hypothetical protein
MPTRFARRRKASRQAATASEPFAVSRATAAGPTASGNLEEVLFKAYDFAVLNPKASGLILWIWTDGRRVYAATNDRYLSNALYHALRALGRNRVRRWSQGGKWILAYS